MLYFILFTTMLIGVFYLFWYIHQQDNTHIKECITPCELSNQVTCKTTREQFLDNYIWACDVFGVGVDFRDVGLTKLHTNNRTFDIYFVDSVCNYAGHYPNSIEKPSFKVDYNHYSPVIFINYMDEFNNIVLQYRKDDSMIKEIKELGISPVEYLSPVNKHQPKPIDIE